jgi:hypothetical protein
MKRNLVRIIVAFVVVLGIAQFFRPERTNPNSDSQLSLRAQNDIPPEVLSLLDRACFDCHSNDTRWPWYSNITPVNFALMNHVNGGRKHLNFSLWGAMRPGTQRGALDEITDEVREGRMPLKSYLLLHPEATLTDDDVMLLSDWATMKRTELPE